MKIAVLSETVGSDGVENQFDRADYVGFAIGPRSLHIACKLVVGNEVHYLSVGQVLPLKVSSKKLVKVVPILPDGSDSSNFFAGWALDGAGTLQDTPIDNVLKCVPLEVWGYECLGEAAGGPPQRHPYLVTNAATNWTTANAEHYRLPFLGRARMSLLMENTAGVGDITVAVVARSFDLFGSGGEQKEATLESGIVVSPGTANVVDRLIEREEFDLVVLSGSHASESGSTTNFQVTVKARDVGA